MNELIQIRQISRYYEVEIIKEKELLTEEEFIELLKNIYEQVERELYILGEEV